MLKPLQKKMVKYVIWLIVIAFVAGGVGTLANSNRNYAGIIFGQKISPQEYKRSYYAVFNNAKMRFGDNLPKMQQYLNLENQAWDRLILLYFGKKNRIKVRNNDIIETISSMPLFQKEGAFDNKAYSHIVENIFNVTRREFEESVGDDIIISKVIDLSEKDISVTEEEIKEAYIAKNEKADISYIYIEANSFENDVKLNEDELEPFYETHREQFRAPEQVSVNYVKIPFNKQSADTKDNAKDVAEEINGNLISGENFNSLADAHNLTMHQTLPFILGGNIPGIGLSYPFSITAFGLSDKRFSNIVEEKDAFYVIKLKEKIAPFIPTFNDVKDNVRIALKTDKAKNLAKEASLNYAKLLLSKESTLDSLSEQINTEVKKIEGLTREGHIEGIGINEEFSKACFKIKEKEFTGPIKAEKGYCIMRLDKLTSIDNAQFEKEKEAFKESLLNSKKEKAFRGWFTSLKKKANLQINIPEK